uniref:(northern house mosquito) hypothetical protein n=1 Tax=Culex pipiens TaxID=7175 RepID=A0A8D8G9U1_CULPI
MDSSSVHTNCIKLQFTATSKMPTDSEIFGFFQKRGWLAESLVAMFRAPREHCVYVKFKTEELLTAALLECPSSEAFLYDSGETVQVTFSTGRGNFRYVRLFGLPVEVDNKHVVNVLEKYGRIHQTVRERYGPDTGYPILNGVRGVHMEISKEIPCQLHVQHFQLRVFYDGIINKCYSCGSAEHIKVDCPKRKSAGGRPSTYAEAMQFSDKNQFPAIQQNQTAVEPVLTPVPAVVQSPGCARNIKEPTIEDGGSLEELPFSSSPEIPDAPVPKEIDDSLDLTDQGRSISKKRLRSMLKDAKKQNEKGSDSSPEKTKVPRSVRVTEEQAKLQKKK